jgi:hypothetical protein
MALGTRGYQKLESFSSGWNANWLADGARVSATNVPVASPPRSRRMPSASSAALPYAARVNTVM